MRKTDKIAVFGSSGLVGSAILRNLLSKGYNNIIGVYNRNKPEISSEGVRFVRLDLIRQSDVEEFFKGEKPDYVFLAAAKVGGIWANNIYRADFIYQNLQIQLNVIHFSYVYQVKKLLFLGSTCIYPRECPQPMKEEYLLTGELEYTNEPYAIAKIAGMKMCDSYNIQYGTNFISVMPTNLYGYNDNFDLETSHVLPALLRKMHLAKALMEHDWDMIRKDLNKRPIEGVDGTVSEEDIINVLSRYGIRYGSGSSESNVEVEVWGTGKPKREFLWSEDLADACVYLMEKIDFSDIVQLFCRGTGESFIEQVKKGVKIRNTHINIGTGHEITIRELVNLIKNIVGFNGNIFFNTSKPDGTPRKVTDVKRLKQLGWEPRVSLEEGVKKLYKWYCETL